MAQTYSWPALSSAGGEDFATLREQARSQGYDDGYQAGHQQAVAELESLRMALSESIRQLPEQSRRIDEADQQSVVALIEQICRTLLGVELHTNSEVLSSVVNEAVERLNCQRSELTLVISPQDEEWLHCEGLNVLTEPAQEAGHISLRGPQATIEFDPQTQLEALMESMNAAE